MALNFEDIDCSTLNVTTPQKMTKRSGMLQAYLNAPPTGRNLVFQTPRMVAQWGIKEWEDNGQGVSYTLGLPFLNYQNDVDIRAFYEKMQELDEYIIKTAVANSPDWFNGKTLSEETVRDKYSQIVKPSKDTRWAPRLNLKLLKKDGEWVCRAYGEDCKPAIMKDADGNVKQGLDVLEKMDEVICVLEVAYIFINAQTFGPTLRLKQVMIFKSDHLDFEDGSCQIVPPPKAKTSEPLESYTGTVGEDEA